MSQNTLLEQKPMIRTFQRAVGGITPKGYYKKSDQKRSHDGFIYILSGSTHYDFGDYTLDAKEGDILYLARGSVYNMDVRSDHYAFIFANFDFDVAPETSFRCECFPAPGRKSTEELFHRLASVYCTRHSTSMQECMSLLYAIYADFLSADENAYYPSAQHKRIALAADYIEEHLTEETLSVTEVAAHVQMSVSYFRRTFKELYRLSPLAYIQMRRISRAKLRLRYSEDTVTAVAEAFGYSSVYYFSHAFKKETGCTPGEYRRRHRGSPMT